jgi:hypothetical protein
LVDDDRVRATAVWIMTNDGTAGLAFQPEIVRLGLPQGDAVDYWLGHLMELGLAPTAGTAAPTTPTPGWRVTVQRGARVIRVLGPDGDMVFESQFATMPEKWAVAVAATGRCVVLATSRTELGGTGLSAAAERGRLLVGLAEATVEP